MASDRPAANGRGQSPPEEEFSTFLNALNDLKARGCTLLVVGDDSRDVFTRASGQLLGDPAVLRHRVLAVTDATPRSIAKRLPDPGETPRPLAETTRILNHAGVPRSVTADATDAPPELVGIREDHIADPGLRGLQSALGDAIDEAGDAETDLRPADLRVGIDSLDPLVDHYGVDVVARCLDEVGEHVRDRSAMAHFVLRKRFDADPVRSLLPVVDAAIELRTVDPEERGHAAQQRWHVPSRDLTTEWTPL